MGFSHVHLVFTWRFRERSPIEIVALFSAHLIEFRVCCSNVHTQIPTHTLASQHPHTDSHLDTASCVALSRPQTLPSAFRAIG